MPTRKPVPDSKFAAEVDAVSGRRVLVVEDESRLREMLIGATRQMEFDVSAVGSAEAALGLLEKHPYDIVLTDLNLPGRSGMELCDQVRQRWPHSQLIILTGFGDLEAAKSAIRLDVADFLTKPSSLGQLEAALNRALRRRREAAIDPLMNAEVRREVNADERVNDPNKPRTLADIERDHVLVALARNDGNRENAAAELGISVRTLYYRLREYERQGFIECDRASE